MNKRPGFTLAEVLITLGIIGVVAAMTIPTLIQNYKRTETLSRLKKFYSMTNQAIKLSEIANGEAETWDKSLYSSDDENYAELQQNASYAFFIKYIAPYLKYTKISNENFASDNDGTPQNSTITVYLADSSTITIYNGACMDFIFDTNGIKQPNVYGKDRFDFLMCANDTASGNNSTLVPAGSGYNWNRDTILNQCKNNAKICALLIYTDGWEIKKDYPYKF